MLEWHEGKDNLIDVVSAKNTYHTKKLIVCAGAYVTKLIKNILPVNVERKVVYFIKP